MEYGLATFLRDLDSLRGAVPLSELVARLQRLEVGAGSAAGLPPPPPTEPDVPN